MSLWFIFSTCQQSNDQLPPPSGLMVELLTQPEDAAITAKEPEFSWIVQSREDSTMQSAYQVLVASDSQKIVLNNGDIWNSGKVSSQKSVNVQYKGNPLEYGNYYWWKVKVWDHQGNKSKYSKPRKFYVDEAEEEKGWPGESPWLRLPDSSWVFEDRHAIRYHDIAPVSVTENQEGHPFITFEKAAFATLQLNLDPARATADSLVIHLGERKDPAKQEVDRQPGGSIVYKKQKLGVKSGKTEYQLKLPRAYSHYPNSQVLAPHMPEVTSFRFVEIENYKGELTTDDIRQKALFYKFDESQSRFASSNARLDSIWDICKYTLKATPFLGLYIDGIRERMPYEADAFIQQVSHYAVDREYAIGRYSWEFLLFNPAWPTEWHLHMPLMAWHDYLQTGNKESLSRYYDDLKAKTLLPLSREDGLISTRTGKVDEELLNSIHFEGDNFRDIVDWPQGVPANEEAEEASFGSERIAGETDRYVFSDYNTVVNAFHYRNLVLMERIAGVLGKDEEVSFFNNRAEKVRQSFNQAFLDKERGVYTDGIEPDHASLHANMFPVAFGLAPEEHYNTILELVKDKGMACSPYGAYYLLQAIYELGDPEYALSLITNETDRGWLNMLRTGATITTEAWDMKYKNNMTWNHAWGASPAYHITRNIMGVKPLDPTFKKIQIKPQPGDLEHASIKTPTIRGSVKVSFEKSESSFDMEFTIPANTSAQVVLPEPEGDTYKVMLDGEEVKTIGRNGGLVIDEVLPGKHSVSID
ncbi:MAG: alpha-L-rhamnosidase C-terminal domain-containing protein [Bacteroidales bacterium]